MRKAFRPWHAMNSCLPKNLGRHIAKLKSEGFADYRVFPEGVREVYGPELFIEPFIGNNIKVVGFDPLAIPAERAAIERARDSDDVAISGKLTLAQDSGTEVPGFVMYVPIYQRGELQGDIAARRAHCWATRLKSCRRCVKCGTRWRTRAMLLSIAKN